MSSISKLSTNLDTNLSRDFKLREFVQSYTAERLGLANIPSDIVIQNLERLCILILQPIRDFLCSPIIISSGYRSPALNSAVKGAKHSYHLLGRAADITSCDIERLKSVVRSLVDLGRIKPTEYIEYSSFIHLAL